MDGEQNRFLDKVYRAASGCYEDRPDEPGVQHEPIPVFEEHCLRGGENPRKASKEAENKGVLCEKHQQIASQYASLSINVRFFINNTIFRGPLQ
jgi:hypothetical protein